MTEEQDSKPIRPVDYGEGVTKYPVNLHNKVRDQVHPSDEAEGNVEVLDVSDDDHPDRVVAVSSLVREYRGDTQPMVNLDVCWRSEPCPSAHAWLTADEADELAEILKAAALKVRVA